MAFKSSARKVGPREEEVAGELNIVPYLDILMNLIIFILLSMTGLATFGSLNASAPRYGPNPGPEAAGPPPPALLLTVAISARGFHLAASGGVLPGFEGSVAGAPGEAVPTVAKLADGTFDYAALTSRMKEIKLDFPTETKVAVAADKDIPYEELVATMDALRETSDHQLLFPDVTLGTF